MGVPATSEIRNQQDCEDLIFGLTLFGTGGGGNPERGQIYINGLLEAGYRIRWTPISEIAPDAVICSVFGMGSIAPHSPMDEPARRAYGIPTRVTERPGVEAVKALGRYLGVSIMGIVPFELGSFNTLVAVDAALRLDVPVIDGDFVGRAVPELNQALPVALDIVAWPLAISDPWGNAIIVERASSAQVAERLGKAISTVTKKPDVNATCAHAGFAHSARTLTPGIVQGTLSRSLAVGRLISSARREGNDAADAIAQATGGQVAFRGELIDKDWSDVDGYMVGTTDIVGGDAYSGSRARIWFKNENHLIWVDGRVTASSPDLICVVNSVTSEPRTNAAIGIGERVAVVVIPAKDTFRSGAALKVNEPRHYGYDIDYQSFGD